MKILRMDEFWAGVIMIALLIVNELVNIPYEIVLMVAGAVGAWLGKAGLDSWKRRIRLGKEQFEAARPKKGTKSDK